MKPGLERKIEALLQRLPGAREDVLAAVNGAVGDRLAAAQSSYALDMRLYVAASPAPALTHTGDRVCLLIHGLMGSRHAWSLGTAGRGRTEFGSALATELGLTPIYLRYNSGRHISSNGRELATQLDRLFRGRSEPPEVDMVAHSMGGLVARSALHYGTLAKMPWVERVQRVFLLGTPNHGVRLEQLAHVAGFTLETIWNPWTKLIGKAINLRSDGIKDLRHGFCLDDDWRYKDQDVLRLSAPRPTVVPPAIRWFVVAGQLAHDKAWLTRLLGDGLVRSHSARGLGFGSPAGRLPSPVVRILEDRGHLSLLNDPEVLAQLIAWWRADEDLR